jgi:hypothetical protein
MKRNNPLTNKPFKRGDIREDGRVFKGYKTTKIKKDGYYVENWVTFSSFEKQNKYNYQWKKQNQQKTINYIKLCRSKNPLKYKAIKNAITAKRRSSKLQRTPPWLNKDHLKQIAQYYQQAKQLQKETGIVHHVDHIIPLQGKTVSGLHVPWNLQILTASENIIKSNKILLQQI